MPNRTSLRAELCEAVEDLVMHAHQCADRRTLVLAERCLLLVERQYAGIERALDELNYAQPTAATLRMERAVEMAS